MSRTDLAAGLAGGVGLAAAAAGWSMDAHAFYGGWIAALAYVAGWPLGSLALLLIHALTGGRWGEALRPALLTGVCALPLLLPALVPLAAGLQQTYGWAQPGAHPANAFYLNAPFLAVRGIVYLAVWFGLGGLVLAGAAGRIAAAGLFVLAVTTSFAAIDLTMSLDAKLTSSIFGMLSGAGMVLLALSVAVLLTAAGAGEKVREDLGKLLLALVILWIYLDFMQLLIIWQSDLASDAPWYLPRSRGGWGALRIGIALGHFVAPAALLLSPRRQRSTANLIGVAALLVAMEAARAWWVVLPSLGLGVGWIDVACMAGLGGAAFAFARFLAARPPVAHRLRHV